uniref:Uncharacterized protein n=1 Tax=Arion vulgaris TaxID=1028688 RepID=A0A0B6ZQC9_9EUPU
MVAKSGKPHGEEIILPEVTKVLNTDLHMSSRDIIKICNNILSSESLMIWTANVKDTFKLQTTKLALQLKNQHCLEISVCFRNHESFWLKNYYLSGNYLETDTKKESVFYVVDKFSSKR